jgi:serine/threonine protein kinase
LNEVRAIDKLCTGESHPNIVKVLRHGRLRPNHVIYFIDMEKCDANLEEYINGTSIKGLTDWKLLKLEEKIGYLIGGILDDIVNGLAFIHKHDEVHRDISPRNSKL